MWRGPWQVGSPPQSWRPDKLPFKQTLTHQPVATVSVSLWWASADRSHSVLSLLHLISFSFACFLFFLIHLYLVLFFVYALILSRSIYFSLSFFLSLFTISLQFFSFPGCFASTLDWVGSSGYICMSDVGINHWERTSCLGLDCYVLNAEVRHINSWQCVLQHR